MKLKTKPVSKSLPEYMQIRLLIKRAFPKDEQLPMWLLRLLSTKKNIDFTAYYDENTFCGITYTVQNKNMAFVLYLAVNDEIRSKGYGSAILAQLKVGFKRKPISLNVETLDLNAKNYDQRVRRVAFYKKNGFLSTNQFLSDKKTKYLILSTAENFSAEDYQAVLRTFSCGLYTPKILHNERGTRCG